MLENFNIVSQQVAIPINFQTSQLHLTESQRLRDTASDYEQRRCQQEIALDTDCSSNSIGLGIDVIVANLTKMPLLTNSRYNSISPFYDDQGHNY